MFDRLNRGGALTVMLATALIVGHPVVWASGLVPTETSQDSFPISTYPMFASAVPEVYSLHHIIATGRGIPEVRVPKHLWAVGGMNQARGQLDKAVVEFRRDKKQKHGPLRDFCTKAARRIARQKGKDGSPFAGANRVQIVRSQYHLKNYFLGSETAPIKRQVVLSCPIKRPKRSSSGATQP